MARPPVKIGQNAQSLRCPVPLSPHPSPSPDRRPGTWSLICPRDFLCSWRHGSYSTWCSPGFRPSVGRGGTRCSAFPFAVLRFRDGAVHHRSALGHGTHHHLRRVRAVLRRRRRHPGAVVRGRPGFSDFAAAGRWFGGFYQAMAFLNTRLPGDVCLARSDSSQARAWSAPTCRRCLPRWRVPDGGSRVNLWSDAQSEDGPAGEG